MSFPGDHVRCPKCGNGARVRRDGELAAHFSPRAAGADGPLERCPAGGAPAVPRGRLPAEGVPGTHLEAAHCIAAAEHHASRGDGFIPTAAEALRIARGREVLEGRT